MRLPAEGRIVVRCPNQHEFETDLLNPEQFAVKRFVCELCGAKFTVELPRPPFTEQRPGAGKPGFMDDLADKR